MLFEYNIAKSNSNKVMHGIDFKEAQEIWNDPMFLEVEARVEDEPRYLVVGIIDGKH